MLTMIWMTQLKTMDSLGLIDSLSIQSMDVCFNKECTLIIQLNLSLVTIQIMICKLQFFIELIKKMVQVQFPKKCCWNAAKIVDVDDNLIGCWYRNVIENLIMYYCFLISCSLLDYISLNDYVHASHSFVVCYMCTILEIYHMKVNVKTRHKKNKIKKHAPSQTYTRCT